jgi:hypothetical protein
LNKILKVGFLINNYIINNNIINIINYSFTEKNIKIFIINNKNNNNFNINNFILRILLFIEYFKLKNFYKAFRVNQINFHKIKKLNLDLIVTLQDENIEKCENLSKYGIIKIESSYRYLKNCDKILSGFWEVYKENSFTHFSIKYLNKKNNLFLLREGCFPTKNYFSLNQKLFYEKSFYYLKLAFWDILKKNSSCLINKKNNSLSPVIKNIESKILLNYLINLGKKYTKNIIISKIYNKKFIWSVYYGNFYWKKININKKINKIQNTKNSYLADPFIINFNKKKYLFSEEYNFNEKKGVIVLYNIINNKYERIGVILKEDFHLSFPYVFKFKGKLYLLPETSQNKDIRIYECIKFPFKWKLKKILMNNLSSADNLIFYYNKFYWLFCNIALSSKDDHDSELSIFYSKNTPITNKWIPHKNNPIITNAQFARNAGIIFDNNKIYRISQKYKFNLYGSKFLINKIMILNKNLYKENPVKYKFKKNKSIIGYHHLFYKKNDLAFDCLKLD